MKHFKAFLIFFFGISGFQFSDGAALRNLTSESESQASFRENLFKNGPCELHEFRCFNDECINRDLRCNGKYDCDDRSDEKFCKGTNRGADCPTIYPFFDCGKSKESDRWNNVYYDYDHCIPLAWVCDGIIDCKKKLDEANCTTEHLITKPMGNLIVPKQAAVKWLLGLRRNVSLFKWGAQVHHTAVALHLVDSSLNQSLRSELGYEVSLQVLARLLLKKIENIPTAELAQYINAFLATCINPRKFFTKDLVAELRKRVDAQTYTNPFFMIALCNAGDDITEKDVRKLHEAFNNKHKNVWTDIQAYAVMALACAGSQAGSSYDMQNMGNLTMELKKKQLRNGTVDNLRTTALVMQALFAAEEEDEENFSEEKAIRMILSHQLHNGSFGDLAKTYYVLPLLNHKSLINISFDHCSEQDEEDMSFKDLIDQGGPKWFVQYSLWIGEHKDLQRTLKLRVPANTTLYGVMETAAQLDFIYRFKFSMKDGKPYIYSLANIEDDPENEKFWFPYTYMNINNTSKFVPIESSPADVTPSNNQHVIYWYKTASWN